MTSDNETSSTWIDAVSGTCKDHPNDFWCECRNTFIEKMEDAEVIWRRIEEFPVDHNFNLLLPVAPAIDFFAGVELRPIHSSYCKHAVIESVSDLPKEYRITLDLSMFSPGEGLTSILSTFRDTWLGEYGHMRDSIELQCKSKRHGLDAVNSLRNMKEIASEVYLKHQMFIWYYGRCWFCKSSQQTDFSDVIPSDTTVNPFKQGTLSNTNTGATARILHKGRGGRWEFTDNTETSILPPEPFSNLAMDRIGWLYYPDELDWS